MNANLKKIKIKNRYVTSNNNIVFQKLWEKILTDFINTF